MGVEEADKADIRDLSDKMGAYKGQRTDLLENEKITYWNDLLGRVPAVKDRYQKRGAYLALYLYKAWTWHLAKYHRQSGHEPQDRQGTVGLCG